LAPVDILRLNIAISRHHGCTIVMTGGVPIMRARKVARKRRAMSPDYLQVALASALAKVRGMCSYHWRKKFSERGYPNASVYIVIQLGYLSDNAAAAQAAVHVLTQELEDVVSDLTIIVALCDAAFWPCAMSEELPVRLSNDE
jgi:hypothetical protein